MLQLYIISVASLSNKFMYISYKLLKLRQPKYVGTLHFHLKAPSAFRIFNTISLFPFTIDNSVNIFRYRIET